MIQMLLNLIPVLREILVSLVRVVIAVRALAQEVLPNY
jgi:hypothetical protein